MAAYAELLLRTDDGRPITPAAHHWLWLTLLCDERIRRLLIIAPPESAKTTWLISAFAGAYVGVWPERNIIIGSVSDEVAEKRALSLRAMVESPAWQAVFPGVLPVKASVGLKWTTAEWSVAPGGQPRAGRIHPTVFAVGRGGSVIGSRADLLIGDDLLDFDSTRTQHQRQMGEAWIHNSFLSRVKARTGRAVIIGNAWHADDYYAKARREGGWVVCHMGLLGDGADVYATLTWPDGWPAEARLGEPVGQAEAA